MHQPHRYATVLLLLFVSCATAPVIQPNRHGLPVVRDLPAYERLVAADPNKRLIDVQSVDPAIRIDVRYATANNFMHEPLYLTARVLARRPVAKALHEAAQELKRDGLGLKVFDGYRPYRVTERMWERIHNPDFVADPAKGSRHNRGAAIDLTLIELATGRELAMPTPYDDFTARARQDFNDLPPDVLANRAHLRDIMVRHGFEPLPTEWWHFDIHGWEKFELMDVGLEDLAR